MRRLLLDTHIWLWFVAGSADLSESLRDAIEETSGACWLSPISIWDFRISGVLLTPTVFTRLKSSPLNRSLMTMLLLMPTAESILVLPTLAYLRVPTICKIIIFSI